MVGEGEDLGRVTGGCWEREEGYILRIDREGLSGYEIFPVKNYRHIPHEKAEYWEERMDLDTG